MRGFFSINIKVYIKRHKPWIPLPISGLLFLLFHQHNNKHKQIIGTDYLFLYPYNRYEYAYISGIIAGFLTLNKEREEKEKKSDSTTSHELPAFTLPQ